MTDFNRLRCIKCDIDSLKSGEYVVKEGWNPNFIKTKYGDISRADLIGVVIIINNEKEFVIDDLTGKIAVRSFDTSFPVNVGEIVRVIGRPREYGGERYIYPEIVRKISKGWMEYRKKELELLKDNSFIQEKTVKMPEQVVLKENNDIYEKIIKSIKRFDSGEGALKSDVISECGENTENVLNQLIEEGEIFENAPGRIKVLE